MRGDAGGGTGPEFHPLFDAGHSAVAGQQLRVAARLGNGIPSVVLFVYVRVLVADRRKRTHRQVHAAE